MSLWFLLWLGFRSPTMFMVYAEYLLLDVDDTD